jgi:beta-xylosidase
MRKVSAVLVFLIFWSGCSTEKPKQARTTNTQTSANKDTSNVNQNATPKSTEEVVQSQEINFRDGIPTGWEKIDPEKENLSGFETKDGILKLTIPSGKDLYGENRTAPRLLRLVTGNFEIETRVKFLPKQDYQGAGILVFSNDSNYLRLERCFGGTGGGESGIRFDSREDEIYEPVATPDNFPTIADEVELKIRRVGNTFTAFWREVGKNKWIEVGKVTANYPETVQIGLIGINTADEITVEFAYIIYSTLP